MSFTGRSAAASQASPAAPGATVAVLPAAVAAALLDSGEYVPLTSLRGAPLAEAMLNPPDCSPSLTVAAAVPVFLTVRVLVVCSPQPTDPVTEVLSSVNCPALSAKSAPTALSACTFAVLSSPV